MERNYNRREMRLFVEFLNLVNQHFQFLFTPGFGRRAHLCRHRLSRNSSGSQLLPHLRQEGRAVTAVAQDDSVHTGAQARGKLVGEVYSSGWGAVSREISILSSLTSSGITGEKR